MVPPNLTQQKQHLIDEIAGCTMPWTFFVIIYHLSQKVCQRFSFKHAEQRNNMHQRK